MSTALIIGLAVLAVAGAAFFLLRRKSSAPKQPAATGFMWASNWLIGPIINGVNYSKGMPATPSPDIAGWWSFLFPRAPGEVDYLTCRIDGDISKAKAITLDFEIIGDGDFVTTENPKGKPRLCMYFQRSGDNWSGAGKYEDYRWYAVGRVDLKPGRQSYSVPLTPSFWKSLMAHNGSDVPDAFEAAKRNCVNVGFVFGGGGGAGHGVYIKNGAARFIVHAFRVN